MGNLMKRGGDDLWGGVVIGAIAGVLVAGSGIPWVQSIVTSVMNAIPANITQYFGVFKNEVVFGVIGAVAGYIIDRF